MRLTASLAAMLLCGSAHAQMLQSITNPVTFVGVVDKDTTATHFWGVVAASAAKANAAVSAVDLCNATGCAGANLCTAVKVTSSGQLDVSGGLYCNSASQTVTAWCSTNCAVSSNDTVARISKIYDQVGSANMTSASYAVSPGFVLSGVNGKPTAMCVRARSTLMTASITTINTPLSVGFTFERWANFTSFAGIATDNGGSQLETGSFGAANSVWVQAGNLASTQITGATDGSSSADFSHFHRVLTTLPTGAGSGAVYIDGGAGTTITTTGSNNTSTPFALCGYTSNFSASFITNMWLDNTQVGATAAQATTNPTTVPFP